MQDGVCRQTGLGEVGTPQSYEVVGKYWGPRKWGCLYIGICVGFKAGHVKRCIQERWRP